MTADQAAVQMWQTAFPGLTIKTTFLSGSGLISVVYGPNVPQIAGLGWVADYPDPEDWLSLQFGNGAINNTGFVNVPAADVLMAEADQNLNPAARWRQYNQAEQLLITDVAWIPLDQAKQFWNVPAYVHNFSLDAFGVIPLGGSSSWQTIYLTRH